MPYIKSMRDREDIAQQNIGPSDSGQLNYKLTKVIWDYYRSNGGRYAQINDILGALEGAKLEFYRRVAAPYEDKKIEENGDVYQ